MPQNGCTVTYLKSVLGQAKGYLRPLQEDIPLLGKPDADFSDKVRSSNLSAGYGGNEPQDNSPKVNCINCHALVPINNMRGHQDSCSGGSSSGVSRRHRNQGIEQYLSHDAAEPVQNLQQLFPDMPVSEVENALEAVNGDINEAAGVILNQSSANIISIPLLFITCTADEDDDEILMPDVQLSSVLEKLGKKLTGAPRRITVDQCDVLADILPLYKDPEFDPSRPVRVVFKDQPAVDSGGPRKEMYSLVYKTLACSTVYKLFEGQAGRLMPFHNASTVFSGMMKTLGKMIALTLSSSVALVYLYSPQFATGT
ncbi:unnamed protein product [Porites lobata]|uniref:CUE domain-containing protein n=1 Tax=Porites lobata TaxID=104759 RepID=A0ABN8S8V5_9CNID|nr:unnamed protein product [Porites lobata]